MTYATSFPVMPQRLTLGQLWFSFTGRATRSDYWLRFLVIYLVGLAISMVLDRMVPLYVMTVATDAGTQTVVMPVVQSLYSIICIWPGLAAAAKRCHDRDRSGWFLLIGFIPVIGSIWLLVELGFLRGAVGPNRFGADPLG